MYEQSYLICRHNIVAGVSKTGSFYFYRIYAGILLSSIQTGYFIFVAYVYKRGVVDKVFVMYYIMCLKYNNLYF